jgi:hypothetical protein
MIPEQEAYRRAEAIFGTAWAISTLLEEAQRLLKARGMKQS